MINASDHYSFQRPSALVLATLGNIIIKVYNIIYNGLLFITYLYRPNINIPQNMFTSYRYAVMRLYSRGPRKGTVCPVTLGENCSVVLAPSQHVTRKHSPIGSGSRSTWRISGPDQNTGLHRRCRRFVTAGTPDRVDGGKICIPRERRVQLGRWHRVAQ